MNRLRTIAITLFLTLGITSCIKDDRDNFLPDESVYLLKSSLCEVKYSEGRYYVILIKSGKGLSPCDVTIKMDEEALNEYNIVNDMDLVSLPENVFTLSETSVHFSEGDFRKTVEVTWEPAALSALLNISEYAIPLTLECRGLEAVSGKSTIIIQPIK